MAPSAAACAFLAFASPWTVLGQVFNVPVTPFEGPSTARFQSGLGHLDGQRVTPYPNSTSFDWWYFDVASESHANESAIVTFFQSTPGAFLPVAGDSYLTASLDGTFRNGTAYSYRIPVGQGSSVKVVDGIDSISGHWGDTGFSFKGKSVRRTAEYTVEVNNPAQGIRGTITYQSFGKFVRQAQVGARSNLQRHILTYVLLQRAPAHNSCGTQLSHTSELIVPHIGWFNAIPDAKANVRLNMQGEDISFQGVGYHDKNWGDRPFRQQVKSWYWGHSSVGPYSVVWFDALAKDSKEYVSGYVTKNGKVLQASCKRGAVKARPYGNGNTYPPVPSREFPYGFLLDFDLGHGEKLQVNVSVSATVVGLQNYFRFTGKSTATVQGKRIQGRAIGEHFVF
ncbi:hypothetical protein N0V84_009340 [Fusarium piperis]|uniref:AttH domain-containing protein n=1 Tax=Fusarium piperis TaxID=1435070 RepID=A0A9W8W6I6_9HYPO|nr:hypothetical protein N0V84_009340 [Fusarium piperis]